MTESKINKEISEQQEAGARLLAGPQGRTGKVLRVMEQKIKALGKLLTIYIGQLEMFLTGHPTNFCPTLSVTGKKPHKILCT